MEMIQTDNISKEKIMKWLEEVTDPEIPVLNVVEMGIVRKVEIEDEKIVVKITPTYSGCPAMNAIAQDLHKKLLEKGVSDFEIKTDYSETWTTDWMTSEAKRKLKEYGIAPPDAVERDEDFLLDLKGKQKVVPCPHCNSINTKLQSRFGSTACKAQYFCNNCNQPFEHFKCI